MEQVPNGNERIARLEVTVEHLVKEFAEFKAEIKAELKDLRKLVDFQFRLLAGMIIALGLGMSGLMAKGFGWL